MNDLEIVRDNCAAIAARLQNDISRGSDRLTEYERGELAAARHIERCIRELKIERSTVRRYDGSAVPEPSNSRTPEPPNPPPAVR